MPSGWQRLAIRLYLATAACVTLWVVTILSRSSLEAAEILAGAIFAGLIVAYCLAFASGLRRVRPQWTRPRTSMLQYQQAFGDESTPSPAPRARQALHAGLIVPFVIHGLAGLFAGAELVFTLLAGYEPWKGPLEGLGLISGCIGLLVGWLPAIALTISAEHAGRILLAGALGPLIIFGPILLF